MLKYGNDLYNRLLQFEFQSLAPFFVVYYRYAYEQ